ncbi:PIN domain-containing protein [Gilvimarinus sp. SDUM040013]|uniref:PIN domain-containing protein n=1 Tax=Gilvimarinus gilvus TaxID=3058038 RepID=A0ABU4RTN6_9GAMM|nr:PIN domain-containing protein [Gilvimarinus sp. SDUM040013]MDO3386821.1 PIN domain-containing protein [Gilvimarinus sp. SDUM040013]MDX6848249.1 PIN domain-containing protein [Gilvimarinus sp. SDUM040013]
MIIADTGYWLALANRRDKHHARALEVTQALNESLVTTWPVLTEVCHLLLSRLGVNAQVVFMSRVDQYCQLFELTEAHLRRCAELMDKYRDLPMDLTDASLVVLAEELGTGQVLSTDQRDFHTYRWKNTHPFKNLLLTN